MQFVLSMLPINDAASPTLRVLQMLTADHFGTKTLPGATRQNQVEVVCKPGILTIRVAERTITRHHTALFNV